MEKAFIELSTKSWHYKLIRFVLQDSAPTPQNMHNLCPYFWLLIFSLLACPFTGLFQLITWSLVTITKPFVLFVDQLILEPNAKKWKEELSDEQVASIYEQVYGYYGYTATFRKTWVPKKLETQKTKIIADYLNKKGITNWSEWYEKLELEERKRKYAAADFIYSRVSLKDRIENFTDELKDNVSSYKTIIKWTKRVVGLIITSIGLIFAYYVVNLFAKGILYVILHWSWAVAGGIGFAIVLVGAAVGLLYLLNKWGEYIHDRYENGEKIWYIQALYYVFAVPMKAIFYHFLYKFVVLTILWGGCLIIYQVGKSFLGIFGEYFGASYGDYCPGIEWKEEEK